jgi:hypothetical protein
MRCVYWFHPVAWMLERLGGTLAEYAADDLCVSRGRSALSLGDCLLRFASADPKSPSVSFASFRALRKRLERLALERTSSAPLQPVQRWLAPTFAMGLALMISFSIGIGDSTNAMEASVNRAAIQRLEQQQRSLREVIASMHSLPGWEHLPLDLEEQVLSQPLSGPEFNVDVRLVDEQGDPVMNALCAIIENEFEQINRSGYLLMQHEELPLALGATDSNGGVFLRNVRGRQPSTNLNGIVGPVLVILHPEYGIRFSRLARSNRIQKVDLTLESPVHIAGDVATEEGEVVPELPLVVTMFHGPIEGAAEFHEAHFSRSILLPKPKTSSDGSYVLSGLPPEWDCSVSLYPDSRIAAYQPIAIARRGLKFIPTQTRNHDIVVKRSDRPSLVFRCVNADGRESPPLPKAVGLPGQSSFTVDIDGNIVTRSYRSGGGDGSGHMIYDLALQMPLPWVSMRYFRHALDCDEPFEIAVKRGRIVRGKIIDAVALAPLVGVDVRAVPPRPEVLPQQPKWPRDHLMVTASRTNRDGSFEFAITDEAWSLYVDGPIYGYDLPESMLGTRSVIINEWPHVQVIQAGEGDEEIVIALQPQPRLRGRVLDENGQPLANALVSCSYRITERNESVATTNALGEFELLPPPQRLLKNPSPQKNERGPFAYTPPPDDFTYQVSVTSDTGRATLRLPENWRKAANEPLEIVLQPRPGLRTLEGNVFLDGVGVPDFEVGITEGNRPPLDSGSHFEMWQSVNNAIVARAKTDAEGRYRIEIPESEFGMADFYILSTIQNGLLPPRPLPDPYIHRTREETKVSLDGERNVGPDLKFLFKPGTQSIRGRVQSVDGKPFAGANISLRPQKEVEGIPLKEDVVPRERKTVSQSDGSFEFTNLLPGEYFVQGMTPYTGSKWKLWVGVNCKAGDSDVILIMDQKFLEPPEKIAPQSIR